VNADLLQNKTLLIGIGIFGLVLILAGVWMFMRDHRKSGEEDDEDEDDEFEDPESLMDAIIALDDLHRAGKIPDESYQQRRNELKEALKRKAD
jgi:flagellar biosynthesis/type III secretory pathway M-ring protein FliF/YscJ